MTFPLFTQQFTQIFYFNFRIIFFSVWFIFVVNRICLCIVHRHHWICSIEIFEWKTQDLKWFHHLKNEWVFYVIVWCIFFITEMEMRVFNVTIGQVVVFFVCLLRSSHLIENFDVHFNFSAHTFSLVIKIALVNNWIGIQS